jgi:Flp pilus assembly protein TadD
VAAFALAACAPSAKPTLAPAEAAHVRAQALIDSGSSAYRNGDYTAAAKRYASAAVVSPDDPAAYYGLGMALAKLGRDDEARVAYSRARELSRGELDQETIPHEVRYRRTKHP